MKPYDIAFVASRLFAVYLIWKSIVLSTQYGYTTIQGHSAWIQGLYLAVCVISAAFFYFSADWVAKIVSPNNTKSTKINAKAEELLPLGIVLLGIFIFSQAIITVGHKMLAAGANEKFTNILAEQSQEQIVNIIVSLFLILGANWVSKLITKFRSC